MTPGYVQHLVVERLEVGVRCHRQLALQPDQQVLAELRQVAGAGRQPVRVHAEADHVDGRLEQVRRDTGREERQRGGVGGHEVPQPVDDHGGVRLVPGEDHVEGAAHRVHLRVVEGPLPVHRRVAGRHQQRVALAQRHVEVLGEVQHQLPARLRAARLHEAEVASRHGGLVGQVELAEPPALPPVAEEVAHAERRRDRAHASDRTDTRRTPALTWQVIVRPPRRMPRTVGPMTDTDHHPGHRRDPRHLLRHVADHRPRPARRARRAGLHRGRSPRRPARRRHRPRRARRDDRRRPRRASPASRWPAPAASIASATSSASRGSSTPPTAPRSSPASMSPSWPPTAASSG